MKRRDFLAICTGSAGAALAAGCSDDESSPLAPTTNESGIPTGKIGTTCRLFLNNRVLEIIEHVSTFTWVTQK